MAANAAVWRKHAGNHSCAFDVAETTRRLFLFGTEWDELYDAITCDPAWQRIRLGIQGQASGEHVENVPVGFTPERWHLFCAFVSQAGLAMCRAWVVDGKTIPVEEAAQMASVLVSRGAEANLKVGHG